MNAVLIAIVHICAFFGIGLLVATALEKRKIISKHFIVIGAYATSCLIGYVLFYVYALSPWLGTLGTILSYILGLLSIFYLAYDFNQNASFRKIFIRAVLPVIVIIFSLTTLYSAITFSCHYRKVPPDSAYTFYQACVLYNTPSDNALPQFFGQKLLDNRDYDLSVDWHLADRPPLEIGATIGLLDTLPQNNAQLSAYEFFSIVLQLSWVAGLWALLNAMRIRKRDTYFILFISAVTGFYYYNSIYAWPKLLAASFAIAAIALLLYPSKRLKTPPKQTWLAASVMLALSLLAHGSSLFIIVPLAFYLAVTKKLPTLKVLVWCALIIIVTYGPWIIYQKAHTPYDRLVKWHLAGVISSNDKRSTGTTLVESYENITLDNWLRGRAANVNALLFRADNYKIGPVSSQASSSKSSSLYYLPGDVPSSSNDGSSMLDEIRKQEFFALFPAFGVLNIGWVVLLRNKLLKRKPAVPIQPLLLLATVGMALWILLMFSAGSTTNHQNSYTLIMLLFTILAASIATSSTYLRYMVACLQLSIFYLVWVFGLYTINHQHRVLIPVTIVVLFYVLVATWWYKRLPIE